MRHEFEFPLENKSEIQLPPLCVVCNSENPDSQVEIKTGWLEKRNPSEDIFTRHSFTFPCCSGCRFKALASRAISGLATVLGILFAILLMYLSTLLFPNAWESDWVGIPLILVCVGLGVVLTQFIYSPIVVVSQLRYRLFLTFRDENYAKKFEELNNALVKKT